MVSNKLVRNLGVGALAVIAAVAIACGEESLDGAGAVDGIAEPGVSQSAPGRETAPESGRATTATDDLVRANGAGASKEAPAPAGAPPVLQTAIDRKIVQTASLQLQVEEVGAGFEEVGRIATAAGGFVASSKFSYQGERQVASMTIKVPADSLQSVLTQLRGLAEKVDAEDSNATDVTEEFTDLESRLRNLEATRDQLLNLLGRAQSVTDILTVQDRLNGVTGEIEQVKGRMQLLNNLTSLATVTVHLRPVITGTGDSGSGVNLGETISEAWDDSLAFLGGVAEDVLTVVVFAWWVPLIGIPAAAIIWGMARGRERAGVVD